VAQFFRRPEQFSPIEKLALQNCRGSILDVGAGAGIHSLFLQAAGQTVAAIDISPQAVEVMRARGVLEVTCSDLFDYSGDPCDTLLMLGHGIGMVETLAGLDRFLAFAPNLLNPGGQVLVDATDVRRTDDPQHLTYQQANREAGRYIGEMRLQFEFQGLTGPTCGWLHVDPQTLAQYASALGWDCTILLQEEDGDYLARLVRSSRE
jgi:SAM-dependent methyltransferase